MLTVSAEGGVSKLFLSQQEKSQMTGHRQDRGNAELITYPVETVKIKARQAAHLAMTDARGERNIVREEIFVYFAF